uniref:Uncharacterized protein n=1 Tax=Meloidogyne enterolobii TaxID=390850 RepID=A0A6V7VP26_MELEN|nr:unnamed protein product [Meloidogyne enterolobii]
MEDENGIPKDDGIRWQAEFFSFFYFKRERGIFCLALGCYCERLVLLLIQVCSKS